jgi:hypothetical protein
MGVREMRSMKGLRTLHVGGGLQGDRLSPLESKAVREFILHGAGGEGHEIK